MQLRQLYNTWQQISAASEDAKQSWGDSYPTWFSFSDNLIDDLLGLDIPILLTYGTADLSCKLCDLVYFEFIKAQKKNLSHRPYYGLDHNFFGVDENGKTDHENFNWDRVIADVFSWLKTN